MENRVNETDLCPLTRSEKKSLCVTMTVVEAMDAFLRQQYGTEYLEFMLKKSQELVSAYRSKPDLDSDTVPMEPGEHQCPTGSETSKNPVCAAPAPDSLPDGE